MGFQPCNLPAHLSANDSDPAFGFILLFLSIAVSDTDNLGSLQTSAEVGLGKVSMSLVL